MFIERGGKEIGVCTRALAVGRAGEREVAEVPGGGDKRLPRHLVVGALRY